MKRIEYVPYFETSVENHIYGDPVYEFALECEKAAMKCDVDAMLSASKRGEKHI